MSDKTSPLVLHEIGNRIVARFIQTRILDDATMKAATKQLLDVMREGRRNVVLNFADVEYLSSSGLGDLINLHKAALNAGCRFSIANVIPQIFEVFTITRLDKIFPTETIETDEDDPDELDEGQAGVPSRLIPPKPSSGGSVKLPRPPPESE